MFHPSKRIHSAGISSVANQSPSPCLLFTFDVVETFPKPNICIELSVNYPADNNSTHQRRLLLVLCLVYNVCFLQQLILLACKFLLFFAPCSVVRRLIRYLLNITYTPRLFLFLALLQFPL